MVHRREETRTRRRRFELVGAIWSAGFASGDRLVVGRWRSSPVGPLTDVMWATAAGDRVLLASSDEGARFVSAIYRFDRVDVVPVAADEEELRLRLEAGPLRLTLHAGPGWRLPPARWRPPWFTRWVEAPVARCLLGVRAYGVSPTGVREWYRADEYRRLRSGHGAVGARALGPMRPLRPAAGFGFSEPPRRPSLVRVRPLLEDPSGRLERAAAGAP